MNHKVAAWVTTALLVAPVMYVMSYAPMVKQRGWDYGLETKLYSPVNWLMTSTPLGGPLLRWADVCGAKEHFMVMNEVRGYGIALRFMAESRDDQPERE